MPATPEEIQRREQAALAAIKRTFATDDGEFGIKLFVSQHLEELDSSYWQKQLGTETPEPTAVLDLLQLRSHWGGNDEMDIFDFTLPDEVTNYVICVRFNDAGVVEEISMES